MKRKDNPLIWLSASPGNAQVCLVFGINSRCDQASVAARLPEERALSSFRRSTGLWEGSPWGGGQRWGSQTAYNLVQALVAAVRVGGQRGYCGGGIRVPECCGGGVGALRSSRDSTLATASGAKRDICGCHETSRSRHPR